MKQQPAPAVASPPAQSSRRADARRADIQGMRALAVLLVVGYHAGLPLPGGFIGVDIFFVISGFVITGMLLREWQEHGRIRLDRFYIRRFLRLTPALALMVTVTLLASSVVLSPLGIQQNAAETARGAMLLSANYVIASTTGGYFDAAAETNPLLNTWSLSVEEQFYLLFPVALVASLALGLRRGWRHGPVVVVSGALVASLAVAFAPQSSTSWWLGFYSPFSRAWEFALGAGLALLGASGWRVPHRWAAALGFLGVALVLVSVWLISPQARFPGPLTLLPVLGAVLLILAGGQGRGLVTRALGARPMVALGDASYSVYLWHWPAISLALILWPHHVLTAPLAALLAFPVAVASYRYVEQPCRALRGLPRRRFGVLVAATLALPLATATALMAAADHYWAPRVQQVVASAQQMHAGYVQGCHVGPENLSEGVRPCTWHAAAGGTPVYLVGDSNAAQFVEGLIEATAEPGRRLHVATGSSCPLLNLRITGGSSPWWWPQACREHVRDVLSWLEAQPPGLVLVASSDEYWVNPLYRVVDDSGDDAGSESEKLTMLKTALTQTVRSLENAGHQVVLIQTIPRFADAFQWDPATCTLRSALAGCPQSQPLDVALRRGTDVRLALADTAEETGSETLDLSAAICPDSLCLTHNGDFPVYRDGSHLTVEMSRRLAPEFRRLLAQQEPQSGAAAH